MQVKKNPNVAMKSWSTIFFQIGLLIMLFVSYQLIEYKTYETDIASSEMLNIGDDIEEDIPITKILNTLPPPPPPPIAQAYINVVEDDLEIEETVIESSELNQNSEIQEYIKIEEIEEVEEEEEIITVPFAVIEDVPVYPGCEDAGNNEAKKACLSEKIMSYIQKNFNNGLADDLALEGVQRISVQFKIDKYGTIVNVRARAPHPMLEKEAIKVISGLPKMIPGKQRGKPVGVLYSIPIIFKVEAK